MRLSGLQFVAIAAVLVNEALCTTMLFPFVGLYVGVLDPNIDRNAAGYYSGFMIGAFQGAQAIFCSRWGHLSDTVGRKPVFLVGLLGGSVAVLLFGVSSSLWMAMFFRCLHGVCSANAPIAKTYITEMTERKDQAAAFGLLSVCWSGGAFLGPVVGGFLYDPSASPLLSGVPWIGSPTSIFGRNPALLPCLFVSLFNVGAATLVSHQLPESNVRATGLGNHVRGLVLRFLSKRRNAQRATSASQPTSYGFQPLNDNDDGQDGGTSGAAPVAQDEQNQPDDTAPILVSDDVTGGLGNEVTLDDETVDASSPVRDEEMTELPVDSTHEATPPTATTAVVPAATTEAPAHPESHSEFTWVHLTQHPILHRCVPMYMLLCSCAIVYNETLPLYMIAKASHEGLEMTSTDIGVISSINAAISLVCNLVFAKMTTRFETLFLWRVCGCIFAVFMVSYGLATPIQRMLVEQNVDEKTSRMIILSFLSFLSVFRCLATTWMFSLSMMFIANSAPPLHLGKVVGMSHACGSLMRCLWPLIAAPMFAWSIGHEHYFPLNHFMVFVLSALQGLSATILSIPLLEAEVIKREEPPPSNHDMAPDESRSGEVSKE